MKKSSVIFSAAAVLCVLILAACEDDTSCPDPVLGVCVLGASEVGFGSLCLGDSAVRSFDVAAPNSNTKTVSGSVSAGCGDFSILSGGGPFTLAPGARWTVTVAYEPSAVGSDTCVVETGTSCGPVRLTGSAEDCAVCFIDPPVLDFGEICIGAVVQDTFTVASAASNTQPVTGFVPSGCGDFDVLSGEGPFSLCPGEKIEVTVSYAPSAAGTTSCYLDLGLPCDRVVCTGVGTAEAAYFEILPTSASTFDWRSNYLMHAPDVVLSGVTFENPVWNNCPVDCWRVDGAPGVEHGFELQDLLVPAGATSITIVLRYDFEDLCASALYKINGVEHYVSAPPSVGCWWSVWFYPITPGETDILVGTGTGATCDADIMYGPYLGGEYQWIRFSFNGPCASPGILYGGEGRAYRVDDLDAR